MTFLDKNDFSPLLLFLCGDVMTGRGIDQILRHPSGPVLYEHWVRDAGVYVELAEALNGPIPRPVDGRYIWGDALEELARRGPDVRIVNLETAVTHCGEHWPDKGINYRMHPDNASCLAEADIDVCVLANNHVLDWGYSGLAETLETLRELGIRQAGAGQTLAEAQAQALVDLGEKGRVIVFALGAASSGIPPEWCAAADRPGVALLPDLSRKTALEIGARVRQVRRDGDVVIASIHWGGNWGYHIPSQHRKFAHWLVEDAGVDLIHGHSSHHPKGIEVFRGKLILYGCGDFLNDYEGIRGYEEFRGDLSLMYFAALDPQSGCVRSLEMVPLQMHRFRLRRASAEDAEWLARILDRESRSTGAPIQLSDNQTLTLKTG